MLQCMVTFPPSWICRNCGFCSSCWVLSPVQKQSRMQQERELGPPSQPEMIIFSLVPLLLSPFLLSFLILPFTLYHKITCLQGYFSSAEDFLFMQSVTSQTHMPFESKRPTPKVSGASFLLIIWWLQSLILAVLEIFPPERGFSVLQQHLLPTLISVKRYKPLCVSQLNHSPSTPTPVSSNLKLYFDSGKDFDFCNTALLWKGKKVICFLFILVDSLTD